MSQSKDEPYLITVEIVNEQCKVSRMLRALGISRFHVMDIRGAASGSVRHLVRMPLKQFERLPKKSVKTDGNKSNKETSVWFDSDGCDVCNAILSQGSFLISGKSIGGNTLAYTFVARNFHAFKNAISKLENIDLKPRVLEMTAYKPKGKVLTEKQERTLWLALKMGFFDYPRKMDSVEFSSKLKIRASTLTETLRRGMRRLLEHYFET